MDALYVKPGALLHQCGLLKNEGTYSLALIRSSKSYVLRGEVSAAAEEDSEVRRLRSVPRSIQKLLSDEQFGQDVLKNAPIMRNTCMRPTKALQVVILEESRKIPHSLNLKMTAVVSPFPAAFPVTSDDTLSLFQDPINSLPLP